MLHIPCITHALLHYVFVPDPLGPALWHTDSVFSRSHLLRWLTVSAKQPTDGSRLGHCRCLLFQVFLHTFTASTSPYFLLFEVATSVIRIICWLFFVRNPMGEPCDLSDEWVVRVLKMFSFSSVSFGISLRWNRFQAPGPIVFSGLT